MQRDPPEAGEKLRQRRARSAAAAAADRSDRRRCRGRACPDAPGSGGCDRSRARPRRRRRAVADGLLQAVVGQRPLAARDHRHALAILGWRPIGARSRRSGAAARPRRSPRSPLDPMHAELRRPDRHGRDRAWRPPSGRSRPCRGGARCPAAARRRCPTGCPAQWASSALTSVPRPWPGAGCTTRPAGLSSTRRCSSSYSTSSARSPRLRDGRPRLAARATVKRWPGLTRLEPSVITASSRVDRAGLEQGLEAGARQLRQPRRQEACRGAGRHRRRGGHGQGLADHRRTRWTTSRACSRPL